MYDNNYLPPIVTSDSVVFQLIDTVLHVLLIERTQDPFKGMWALPGGYIAAGETTGEAMERVLKTKAGIQKQDLRLIQQLYTFDTVARDPRGHAISVTYMGLGKDITPTGSNTTQHPQFFPITNLPTLAYDHEDIIKYAHIRIQAKITYTNAIFALLDPLFTLSQLQSAYEAVFCRPLDKRNFRKKFLSLNLIQPTSELFQDGAHRPARLYKFNTAGLETLSRSFD